MGEEFLDLVQSQMSDRSEAILARAEGIAPPGQRERFLILAHPDLELFANQAEALSQIETDTDAVLTFQALRRQLNREQISHKTFMNYALAVHAIREDLRGAEVESRGTGLDETQPRQNRNLSALLAIRSGYNPTEDGLDVEQVRGIAQEGGVDIEDQTYSRNSVEFRRAYDNFISEQKSRMNRGQRVKFTKVMSGWDERKEMRTFVRNIAGEGTVHMNALEDMEDHTYFPELLAEVQALPETLQRAVIVQKLAAQGYIAVRKGVEYLFDDVLFQHRRKDNRTYKIHKTPGREDVYWHRILVGKLNERRSSTTTNYRRWQEGLEFSIAYAETLTGNLQRELAVYYDNEDKVQKEKAVLMWSTLLSLYDHRKRKPVFAETQEERIAIMAHLGEEGGIEAAYKIYTDLYRRDPQLFPVRARWKLNEALIANEVDIVFGGEEDEVIEAEISDEEARKITLEEVARRMYIRQRVEHMEPGEQDLEDVQDEIEEQEIEEGGEEGKRDIISATDIYDLPYENELAFGESGDFKNALQRIHYRIARNIHDYPKLSAHETVWYDGPAITEDINNLIGWVRSQPLISASGAAAIDLVSGEATKRSFLYKNIYKPLLDANNLYGQAEYEQVSELMVNIERNIEYYRVKLDDLPTQIVLHIAQAKIYYGSRTSIRDFTSEELDEVENSLIEAEAIIKDNDLSRPGLELEVIEMRAFSKYMRRAHQRAKDDFAAGFQLPQIYTEGEPTREVLEEAIAQIRFITSNFAYKYLRKVKSKPVWDYIVENVSEWARFQISGTKFTTETYSSLIAELNLEQRTGYDNPDSYYRALASIQLELAANGLHREQGHTDANKSFMPEASAFFWFDTLANGLTTESGEIEIKFPHGTQDVRVELLRELSRALIISNLKAAISNPSYKIGATVLLARTFDLALDWLENLSSQTYYGSLLDDVAKVQYKHDRYIVKLANDYLRLKEHEADAIVETVEKMDLGIEHLPADLQTEWKAFEVHRLRVKNGGDVDVRYFEAAEGDDETFKERLLELITKHAMSHPAVMQTGVVWAKKPDIHRIEVLSSWMQTQPLIDADDLAFVHERLDIVGEETELGKIYERLIHIAELSQVEKRYLASFTVISELWQNINLNELPPYLVHIISKTYLRSYYADLESPIDYDLLEKKHGEHIAQAKQMLDMAATEVQLHRADIDTRELTVFADLMQEAFTAVQKDFALGFQLSEISEGKSLDAIRVAVAKVRFLTSSFAWRYTANIPDPKPVLARIITEPGRYWEWFDPEPNSITRLNEMMLHLRAGLYENILALKDTPEKQRDEGYFYKTLAYVQFGLTSHMLIKDYDFDEQTPMHSLAELAEIASDLLDMLDSGEVNLDELARTEVTREVIRAVIVSSLQAHVFDTTYKVYISAINDSVHRLEQNLPLINMRHEVYSVELMQSQHSHDRYLIDLARAYAEALGWKLAKDPEARPAVPVDLDNLLESTPAVRKALLRSIKTHARNSDVQFRIHQFEQSDLPAIEDVVAYVRSKPLIEEEQLDFVKTWATFAGSTAAVLLRALEEAGEHYQKRHYDRAFKVLRAVGMEGMSINEAKILRNVQVQAFLALEPTLDSNMYDNLRSVARQFENATTSAAKISSLGYTLGNDIETRELMSLMADITHERWVDYYNGFQLPLNIAEGGAEGKRSMIRAIKDIRIVALRNIPDSSQLRDLIKISERLIEWSMDAQGGKYDIDNIRDSLERRRSRIDDANILTADHKTEIAYIGVLLTQIDLFQLTNARRTAENVDALVETLNRNANIYELVANIPEAFPGFHGLHRLVMRTVLISRLKAVLFKDAPGAEKLQHNQIGTPGQLRLILKNLELFDYERATDDDKTRSIWKVQDNYLLELWQAVNQEEMRAYEDTSDGEIQIGEGDTRSALIERIREFAASENVQLETYQFVRSDLPLIEQTIAYVRSKPLIQPEQHELLQILIKENFRSYNAVSSLKTLERAQMYYQEDHHDPPYRYARAYKELQKIYTKDLPSAAVKILMNAIVHAYLASDGATGIQPHDEEGIKDIIEEFEAATKGIANSPDLDFLTANDAEYRELLSLAIDTMHERVTDFYSGFQLPLNISRGVGKEGGKNRRDAIRNIRIAAIGNLPDNSLYDELNRINAHLLKWSHTRDFGRSDVGWIRSELISNRSWRSQRKDESEGDIHTQNIAIAHTDILLAQVDLFELTRAVKNENNIAPLVTALERTQRVYRLITEDIPHDHPDYPAVYRLAIRSIIITRLKATQYQEAPGAEKLKPSNFSLPRGYTKIRRDLESFDYDLATSDNETKDIWEAQDRYLLELWNAVYNKAKASTVITDLSEINQSDGEMVIDEMPALIERIEEFAERKQLQVLTYQYIRSELPPLEHTIAYSRSRPLLTGEQLNLVEGWMKASNDPGAEYVTAALLRANQAYEKGGYDDAYQAIRNIFGKSMPLIPAKVLCNARARAFLSSNLHRDLSMGDEIGSIIKQFEETTRAAARVHEAEILTVEDPEIVGLLEIVRDSLNERALDFAYGFQLPAEITGEKNVRIANNRIQAVQSIRLSALENIPEGFNEMILRSNETLSNWRMQDNTQALEIMRKNLKTLILNLTNVHRNSVKMNAVSALAHANLLLLQIGLYETSRASRSMENAEKLREYFRNSQSIYYFVKNEIFPPDRPEYLPVLRLAMRGAIITSLKTDLYQLVPEVKNSTDDFWGSPGFDYVLTQELAGFDYAKAANGDAELEALWRAQDEYLLTLWKGE